MTVNTQHPCAVCGRQTVMRGDRCRICKRLGRSAAPLWCICDLPTPVLVPIFDAVECSTCHRPVLTGE